MSRSVRTLLFSLALALVHVGLSLPNTDRAVAPPAPSAPGPTLRTVPSPDYLYTPRLKFQREEFPETQFQRAQDEAAIVGDDLSLPWRHLEANVQTAMRAHNTRTSPKAQLVLPDVAPTLYAGRDHLGDANPGARPLAQLNDHRGHEQLSKSAVSATPSSTSSSCPQGQPPIADFVLPSNTMLPAEAAKLTPEMLGRAVLGRRGDPNPLRRVASALKRGETVDIVVFGGSVTSGVGARGCKLPGCERPKKGHECRACAWPSQLEAGLRQIYPNARVTVHNLAVRINETTFDSIWLNLRTMG